MVARKGYQGKHRFIVHDLQNECVLKFSTDEFQAMMFYAEKMKKEKETKGAKDAK